MTLWAFWKEGNQEIFSPRAYALIQDYTKNVFTCQECKEELTLKKEHLRFVNHKYVWVVPCFVHRPESTCKKAGESEEHINAKDKLLAYLYCGKIKINLFDSIETYIIPELIKGKEITRTNNRADVLIEFKNFNSIFGNGIVFEIIVSEKEESIEEKRKNWAIKGYSIIPIYANQLESSINIGISFNSPYIEVINKILETNIEKTKNLLEKINSPTSQIITLGTTEYNCENCYHCTNDKINLDLIACWKFKEYHYNFRPDKRAKNQYCNYWSPKNNGGKP